MGERRIATCEACKAAFVPTVGTRGRYCSWSCYLADPAGRDQRGAKNNNWRGGLTSKPYRYKRFVERHPDKVRAHKMVRTARLSGRLKPGPCERCGAEQAHAHHDDYSKPLDVRWLCRGCHAKEHTRAVP